MTFPVPVLLDFGEGVKTVSHLVALVFPLPFRIQSSTEGSQREVNR